MKNRILCGLLILAGLFSSACIEQVFELEPRERAQNNTESDSISDDLSSENFSVSALLPSAFAFTATDIYGNEVSEEALGEKQAFFIHYWGTWCPPCVNEMGDLAEVAVNYADRVGFIGLVDDYESNLQGAVDIIEASGVPDSFLMINANEPSAAAMLDAVKTGYVPTTVIVTADGRISDAIIGANGKGYADILDRILGR
ncbi:MAG: TlpA family protein disulfide reductase [Oscillospiraceae bacterium]|nr:TlpA family protein disulfide reductase [Oscillospiraceae bacterium]